MKKDKTNIVLFLVLFIFIIIISSFVFNRNFEGFYSNNSITSAKGTLNDLISTQLNSISTSLKDISTNKYNLDITSAIGNLGEEMKGSSGNAQAYISKKKIELSNLQKNMNNINKILSLIPSNITVEQIVLLDDSKSLKRYNILDAIDALNTQLKTMVNDLSEIPE
jgi:hypothetical protein